MTRKATSRMPNPVKVFSFNGLIYPDKISADRARELIEWLERVIAWREKVGK